MTFSQIQYVLKIAECKSINRAAQALFVSQSHLSTAIKNLEHEVGNKIFLRTRQGVELTNFGRSFTAYIQLISQQIDQLDNFLSFGRRLGRTKLSFTSNGFSFIGQICAKMLQRHRTEDIQIFCFEDFGIDAFSTVSSGQAAIGVVRLWDCYEKLNQSQLDAFELEFHQVALLDVGFTVGRNNPLFTREEDWVTPEMIEDFPFVLYECLNSGAFSDIFDRLGLKLSNGTIVTQSRAFLYEMLNYTDACYFNSYYGDCLLERGGLKGETAGILSKMVPQKTFRVRDCQIHSRLGWIARKDHTLLPIEEEFIGRMAEYLKIVS